MEKTIMLKRSETHKKKGGVVKKAIVPTICFAALSTIVFEKEIQAASINSTPVHIVSTQKYVNINSGSLNLRSSASTSATIVAALSKGTAVTVYSEANGWAKVNANGKDGYVSSLYLSATNPAANTNNSATYTGTTKYVNINSGRLNLRSSASTSGSIVTTLDKGTAVTVYSETNGWAKVNANGKDGYVSSSFLSATNSNSTGNGSTTVQTTVNTDSTPTTKFVNVSSGSLNMRNSPSTRASVIVKLTKGTSVQVYSEANGWAKIVAYGQTGYVSSEFLSTSLQSNTESNNPVQQSMTGYVNVSEGSSLNLRSSSSITANVLAKLVNGTEVQVMSDSNGWAKVQVNGQTGYVSSVFLTQTKPTSNVKVEPPQQVTKLVDVSAGSSLNMRKSPSISSSIMVRIARGVQVTVLSEADGWAKIEAYGQTGYVSSEFLTGATGSATENSNGTNNSNTGSATENNNGMNNSNTGSTTENSNGTDNSSTGSATENSNGTDNSKVDPATENSASSPGNENALKYVNVIYGSSLNMRSTASTSSSIITKLSRGTAVSVEYEENGWSKITANGAEGYVSSQYLSAAEPFNPNQSSKLTESNFESYDISLSKMVNLEMAVNPQTDKKYNTYIRSDALTLTSPTSGMVKGNGWNVRGGAGTNYWVVGQVSNSKSLQILSKVKGTDGYDWYQVVYDKTWVNASPDDVGYYLNPTNFVNNTVDSLQFLKLSVTANLDPAEINNRILNGKGILQGQAGAFITAGNTCGVNEIYLISHALLETGNGISQLANGVEINGKTVYNMYGIGAYDADPVNTGAQYAYKAGWFTPEAAIIGGAQFIANGYINAGQDTLYKMRWNPISAVKDGIAVHQYATDIGWAMKQVNQIYNLYNLLDSYKLVLDIPKYQS